MAVCILVVDKVRIRMDWITIREEVRDCKVR